ncbi:MAG: multiprotein bridging factor aMBF1 [Candidatus Ranarchaeia archaeon]
MQCEMCGITIKERPIVIKIEGAIMEVCSNCSRFGEKVVPKTKPIIRPAPVSQRAAPRVFQRTQIKYRRHDNFEDQWEILPNISEIIKDYRKKFNLTQKDLASKTGIATTVINRIEAGKWTPPFETVRKFEKSLNIKLLIKEEGFVKRPESDTKITRTLGDIVKIKRK